MKMMWLKPQITEIKIDMTQWNKVGKKHDGMIGEDGSEGCGDITPCPCS